MRIFGYVILENHLHLIARSDSLVSDLRRFKSYTARQIIDEMMKSGMQTILQELSYFRKGFKSDQEHQLWQEGSHPKQIQSEDMMLQKLEHTHNNPVRRGFVDLPEHWRYSSARDYLSQPGLIDVETDWR